MEAKIISIIEEILKVPAGSVNAETKMEDFEAWDSLAHVLIIGALEEQLGIEIPLDEAIEITGVEEILKYASEK
ncbi:MAG: acyl carrier protein [Lachnospiraceae bacterium]|nr:acyl carrier protein [Lachnospiraceae bacterium]